MATELLQIDPPQLTFTCKLVFISLSTFFLLIFIPHSYPSWIEETEFLLGSSHQQQLFSPCRLQGSFLRLSHLIHSPNFAEYKVGWMVMGERS